MSYTIYHLLGCTGTTRLVGAGKLTKKTASNFGPQKGVTQLPSQTSTLSATKTETETKHLSSRLPKVPSKYDQPIYGLKSNKNFITANAVEAILQVPKQIPQEPNYLEKEDFGKIPAYLSDIKSEIERENKLVQRYVDQKLGNINDEPEEDLEELSESERQSLLQALKLKWEKTNGLYQKSTHMVNLDTTGQIRRKELLENELKTIENDILKLERSRKILIS